MYSIRNIKLLSSLQWLLFLCTLAVLMLETRAVSEPLQHRIDGYVTRQGYWSSVNQPSSLTLGGRETYPNVIHQAYVVRVKWGNEIIPGKFIHPSNKGACHIAYGGVEKDCTSSGYELLYNEPYFNWAPRRDGDLCNGAIVGGIASNFEKYFICKFEYYDTERKVHQVLVGNLVPSKGLCFAGYFGQRTSAVYEVLRDSRYT